jgi:hypothetical protein
MAVSDIEIDCPYCNNGKSKIWVCDDGHWWCQQNPAHADPDPAVLIQKLRPNLSYQQAQALVAQFTKP